MNFDSHTIRSLEYLRHSMYLPGDVIELGVSAGNTTIPLALLLKHNNIKKKIYALDTYEGLPYDGKVGIDNVLKKGECSFGFEKFMDRVKHFDVQDYIIPVQGLVENTLVTLSDKTFCFAWFDMDLYKPTSIAQKFIAPRIVNRGVMGFHDYKFIRCPGIEIVVDKEIDYNQFERIGDNWGNCAWLRKK